MIYPTNDNIENEIFDKVYEIMYLLEDTTLHGGRISNVLFASSSLYTLAVLAEFSFT